MNNSQAKKKRTKFIRELGELAILVRFSRHSEGTHAYELFDEIRTIIFPQHTKQMDNFSDIEASISQLQRYYKKYGTQSPEFQSEWDKFWLHREKYPMLQIATESAKNIKDFNEKKLDSIMVLLNSFKKRIEGFKNTISRESVVWTNVSNIYPVLKSMEKDGLIQVIKEITIQGRNRKIYGITELGEKYLGQSIFTIFGFLSVVFPFGGDLNINIFDGRKLFGERSSSEDLALDNLLEGMDVNIDRINELIEKNTLPPFFDSWIFLISVLVLRSDPQTVTEMILNSETKTEMIARKTFLSAQLRKMQSSIATTLKLLDTL